MVKNGKDLSLPFLFVILSFILSLSLYLYTLAPTVTFQDSGEYITAAYTLGIPHPPGNPTWCLLGKLFTYLPFGSIAYRVNLMSAFFAALSVALSFLIFRRLFSLIFDLPPGELDISSFLLSLMAAVNSSLWKKAVVAEVYTLNLFFLLLLIWMTLKVPTNQPRIKWLMAIGFLLGWGAGNHLSLLFIFPAIVIYLLNYQLKPKEFSLLLICLGLGLLVYLYLPIRSGQNPALDSGNPETLKNFLWVILRKQWGGIKWTNINWITIRHGLISMNLVPEFTRPCLFLSLLGLITLGFKKKILFLFLFLFFLFYSFGMIILLAGNLGRETFLLPSNDEFFMPVHWLVILGIGTGILFLAKTTCYILKKIFLLSLPVLLLFFLIRNFPQCNFRRYFLARDLGLVLLEDIEDHGLILSSSDHLTFILLYLQEVEGVRRDVIVLDRSLLTWPVYYNHYAEKFPQINFPARPQFLESKNNSLIMPGLIAKNISRRPIYWILGTDDPWVEERLIPNGATFRLSPSPVNKSLADIREGEKKWLRIEKLCLPWVDKPPHLYGEFIISALAKQQGIYFHRRSLWAKAMAYYHRAKVLSPRLHTASYNLGLIYWQRGALEKARQEFSSMITYDPYSHEGYFNLARIYEEMLKYNEAISAYGQSIRLAPHYADSHYRLGRCLEKIGQNGLARKSYLEALRLDPHYEN